MLSNIICCIIMIINKLCYRYIHHHDYIIKSPPTMWWWRLIVFAQSARRRRRCHNLLVSALTQKPLLGLFPNICIMHIGPAEFVWYNFFVVFEFLQQNPRWPSNHVFLSSAWTASPIFHGSTSTLPYVDLILV